MKMLDKHPTVEVRSVPGEVRITKSNGGARKVCGYGAVFNSRSQVLMTDDGDPFVEQVLKGAFLKSIADSDVRSFYNHESRFILGRKGAGTLRLAEDSTGLEYEVDLGTRSYDRDTEESLDRGDVFGSSFSFATVEDDWEQGEGMPLRSLKQVHLFEVGPVVFPAYRAATATCRSFKAYEARSAAAAPPPPIAYPTPAQSLLLNWFKHADL